MMHFLTAKFLSWQGPVAFNSALTRSDAGTYMYNYIHMYKYDMYTT